MANQRIMCYETPERTLHAVAKTPNIMFREVSFATARVSEESKSKCEKDYEYNMSENLIGQPVVV